MICKQIQCGRFERDNRRLRDYGSLLITDAYLKKCQSIFTSFWFYTLSFCVFSIDYYFLPNNYFFPKHSTFVVLILRRKYITNNIVQWATTGKTSQGNLCVLSTDKVYHLRIGKIHLYKSYHAYSRSVGNYFTS